MSGKTGVRRSRSSSSHSVSGVERSSGSSCSGGALSGVAELKIRRDLRAFFEPLKYKPHNTQEALLCAHWAEVVDTVRGASLVLREVFRSKELLSPWDSAGASGSSVDAAQHGFLELHDIPNVPEDALDPDANTFQRLRAQMEVECPEISLTKGKVFQLLQRMQEEYQRLEEKFETSKHAIRKLTRRLCELAEDSTQQAGNESASPPSSPLPATLSSAPSPAEEALRQENASLSEEVRQLREERALLWSTLHGIQPGFGFQAPEGVSHDTSGGVRESKDAEGSSSGSIALQSIPQSPRSPTGKTRHLKQLLKDRTIELLDVRSRLRQVQQEASTIRQDVQQKLQGYLHERDRCIFRTQLLLQRVETLARSPSTLTTIIQPQRDVAPSVSTANILEQVNSVLKQQLAQSTEDLVLASMSVEDQEEGAAAPGPSGAADEGLTWKGLRPWVPQNLADRMKRLAEQMDVQRTKELVAVVVELRRRFALIQTKLAEDHISHHNHVQQLQADLEVLARERDALSCTVQELSVHPLVEHRHNPGAVEGGEDGSSFVEMLLTKPVTLTQ